MDCEISHRLDREKKHLQMCENLSLAKCLRRIDETSYGDVIRNGLSKQYRRMDESSYGDVRLGVGYGILQSKSLLFGI